VAAAVAAVVAVAVGQIVGVAAAVAAVVAVVVAAAVAVAGAVATGAAAVPLGVGATVAAVLAGVAAAAAVVPAAVLVADGVAQVPATLAALLAPNTLPTFGISNAPPTPPTTATAPTIARSRVRDRGSNSRSWLKTLLRYDTTPFPFIGFCSRAITVALALCRVIQIQDFFSFDCYTAMSKSERSNITAGQKAVDQALRSVVKTRRRDRNNSVRNGTQGGSGASRRPITPGSTIAECASGYLTEPAVMPATRKRCSSRKPTTIGTLTVSDAAMIWFQ
jgi:hypothetical protein